MINLKYLSRTCFLMPAMLCTMAQAADKFPTQVIGPIAPDQINKYCVLDSKAFSPGFTFCYNASAEMVCSAPLDNPDNSLKKEDVWKSKQYFWRYNPNGDFKTPGFAP